jgi:hypothetical protein
MTRNSPDFILEKEGVKMQDPRFVLLKKIPLWRYLFIRVIITLYDRQKEWIRRQEDIER